jgi:hypothetical protein
MAKMAEQQGFNLYLDILGNFIVTLTKVHKRHLSRYKHEKYQIRRVDQKNSMF